MDFYKAPFQIQTKIPSFFSELEKVQSKKKNVTVCLKLQKHSAQNGTASHLQKKKKEEEKYTSMLCFDVATISASI